MKKQLLNLSLAIIVVALFTVNASAQKEINVKKADCEAVLDGEIDDVWKDLTSISVDQNYQTETPSITTTVKAFYTDTKIFVLIESDDNTWYTHEDAEDTWGNTWKYDKPEVYFDVNETLVDGLGPQTSGANEGHYQIAPGFWADSVGVVMSTSARGVGTYAYTFNADDADYVYEYAVVIADLKDKTDASLDVTSRTQIGFGVTSIDNDNDGNDRQRAVWSNIGGVDESWVNMDD